MNKNIDKNKAVVALLVLFIFVVPMVNLPRIDLIGFITIIGFIITVCDRSIFAKIFRFIDVFSFEDIYNLSFEELDWLEWNFIHWYKDKNIINSIFDGNEILSVYADIDKHIICDIDIAFSLCKKGYLIGKSIGDINRFIITNKTAKIIDSDKHYFGRLTKMKIIKGYLVNFENV